MRQMILSFVAVLVVLPAINGAQDEPSLKQDRITAAEFPSLAKNVEDFERLINSPDVTEREGVIAYVAGRYGADKEAVRFMKRVMQQDSDPSIRGLAIGTLHGMFVPLDPSELPATFTGYHRAHLLDRRREGLCQELIKEVRRNNLASGYAAYAVGLLRCREAAAALVDLAEQPNVFVRYSAGRALSEIGHKPAAAAILKTIMEQPVPVGASLRDIEDPHYQALAARAYMELGAAERKVGIDRLIGLMDELARWKDVNAAGRLDTVRRMLATVSGEYFRSAADARAWLEADKSRAD